MSRDFLKRWSDRKLEDGEDGVPPYSEEPVEDERTDPEILEDLGLPDPDTLTAEDDVRAFMSAAVPARLKNRALRRLWTLNPTLANLDGLVEYGEDYTDAATVVANMQTVYEVGRGMVRKVLEAEEEDEPVIAVADEPFEEDEPEPVPDLPQPDEMAEREPETPFEQARPRRMRVGFDEA